MVQVTAITMTSSLVRCNVGTQIDGLAHLGIDSVFYNGNRAKDFVQMDGLKSLG